jgi:hypothetical protein
VADALRALTIRQPWAGLIATNQKTIENRTWAPPKNLAPGSLLAIHAAAVIDKTTNRQVYGVPACCLPLGAVVAVTRLLGAHQESPDRCTQACRTWGWADHWHWQFGDTVAVAQPLPTKGRLGVWTLPADLDADVRRQLGEVSRG